MREIRSLTDNLTPSEEYVTRWLLDNMIKSRNYTFKFERDAALNVVHVGKSAFLSTLTKLKIAEAIHTKNSKYCITVSVFVKGTFHSLVKALGVR